MGKRPRPRAPGTEDPCLCGASYGVAATAARAERPIK